MSEQWLYSWLHDLNLAEYVDCLSQHGCVSPKTLASIVERDQLKAIGVTKMGHISRLLRAIEKLREDSEEGSMSTPMENSCQNLVNSAGLTKGAPPVPKRKTLRHSASSPSSHANNIAPPVQPRDQSLKSKPPIALRSVSSGVLPSGAGVSYTLPSPSTNGQARFADMGATYLTKQKSPTPKPRNKHPLAPLPTPNPQAPLPAPRKRSRDSNRTSPQPEEDRMRDIQTLPVGASLLPRSPSPPQLHSLPELLPERQDIPLENVAVSEGVAKGGYQPSLPPKDSMPPSFAPPPLPPERKYFKENSLPSVPPLPEKTTESFNSPLPPPPPSFQRRLTPEEQGSAPPPKPPPRSSTLPPNRAQEEELTMAAHRNTTSAPEINYALEQSQASYPLLPPKESPPDLPARVELSPPPKEDPPALPVHVELSPPPEEDPPEPPVRVELSPPPEEDPPAPPVRMGLSPPPEEDPPAPPVRMGLSPPPEEDPPAPPVRMGLSPPPEEDPPAPPVRVELSPPPEEYPPQVDMDSEDEEDGMHLMSIKSSLSHHRDSDLMVTQRDLDSLLVRHNASDNNHLLEAEESGDDTPFTSQECSPLHVTASIRQLTSGSQQKDHEDDVILMGGLDDPDYMNQDTIDLISNEDADSEGESEEEDENHVGSPRKIIMSQRSDSFDEILVGGGDGGGRGNFDYMNQETIQETIDEFDPDYMNQETIDDLDTNPDYMNQETIDDLDTNPDYMNQAVIDSTVQETTNQNEDDDLWKSIDCMNQGNIDLLKSVPETDYMNQEVVDTVLVGQVPLASDCDHQGFDVDTEEEFTEDEDDHIRINSYKGPLQIHGTIKTRTLPPASNDQDYENQDVVEEVLDGDIIPMMMILEPGGGGGDARTMSPAVTQSGDITMEVSRSDWEAKETTTTTTTTTAMSEEEPHLGLRTQAEVSSNGQVVSHDSWSKSSVARTSVCSNEDGEGLMPLHSNERSREGCTRSHSVRASISEPLLRKPRSHTEAIGLDSKPHPLNIATTQSSLEETDGFSYDPFSRDYIPPVLPKSAGTFACSDYKKPEFRKFKSTDDYLLGSGHGTSFRDSLSESTMLPGFSRLNSADSGDVPKTKVGFLHKKGGRRNERPWQRRWVVFNGSELKYFRNKLDKDNLCLNIVELEKMIDVKRVPDEVDKQYRFDLVVINRVFQFFSESLEDCQAWVNVLHVAISKFKPQDHEHKEGGSMHDPQKQGYLHKQGHGPFSSKFKERYVALKGSKFSYYDTQEDFKHGRPIHTLEMSLSSVRPDMSAKLPRFIITTNNQKQYYFQTSTDLERNEWIESLTMAIMTGLDLSPPNNGMSKSKDSQTVLAALQVNPTNKTCADCSAQDPEWGVINRGIMVCIKCSGTHRSFGTHLSKVRSIGLDEEIWTNKEQIDLMVKIGNGNSNSFWEHHYNGERLPANVESEIRENFITAKYVTRSWVPMTTVETKDRLSNLLCENVTSDNLMKSIELIALGANTSHLLNDVEDQDMSTPLAIARSNNKQLQAKLLELNGASICRKEDRQSFTLISKKGYLYKTGTDRTGWKRRYCCLDQHRGFEYFRTEADSELQGYIRVEEMFSVAKSEDEGIKDSKYKHSFEVNTTGRGYLFCADTAEELDSWVNAFNRIISSDAADNLGYDKVGYLKKKDSTGWKRRWFTLKGKSLACYRKEREEVDEIDLRKVVELKGPDSAGNPEQQCCIQIMTDDKTYHLKAESPAEAESWLSALRHTQVSGIPLAEQQLTSTGIPIVIHKCLQFIESIGLDIEGLYRISGIKVKIRRLILAFNQDARGVVIDPDKYNVHDVTGTLKHFLHSLPDPVLTHALYPDFIATIQSAPHEAQMYQIQSLLEKLPPVNKETLKRIIAHLRRVMDNEGKNKMSLSNITRLFGPTLMTVDDDPMSVSFSNTEYQCMCIHALIKYYKWLFHVVEDENKKDEAIEEAVLKIKELEEEQKKRAELKNQKKSTITSTTDFLTTIYIGGKLGETFNTHITGISTVQGVVEEVVHQRNLPADNYALYLVLGDSESHRVLCFSERLLAVLCSAGTEHYLCLQRNAFWETLNPHFGTLASGEPVQLHVKERRKWKKYPCCMRDNQFIQFKDSKCHHELFKLGVNEFDIFVGIQQSRIDVKNPMPTRHSFWIKATKGDESCRFFCADNKDEMLKIIAAVVKIKFPSCLQTPVLPEGSPLPNVPHYQPPSPGLDEFNRPFNTSPPLRS